MRVRSSRIAHLDTHKKEKKHTLLDIHTKTSAHTRARAILALTTAPRESVVEQEASTVKIPLLELTFTADEEDTPTPVVLWAAVYYTPTARRTRRRVCSVLR